MTTHLVFNVITHFIHGDYLILVSYTKRFQKRKSTKAKTRKPNELSKIKQNRLAKLNAMLNELKLGKNVQNSRLTKWLTEEKYDGFDSDRESQQQIREELKDKPDELKPKKSYIKLLSTSTKLYFLAPGCLGLRFIWVPVAFSCPAHFCT